MSRKWPKEDRNSFNNSEVMREFEKRIIASYEKLVSMQNDHDINKIAQSTEDKIKGMTDAVKDLNKEVKELTGSAKDGELENEAEEITVEVEEDEENEEVTLKKAKEETLLRLYGMARKAALEGNIRLAYKIERTISELSEE